MLENKPCIVFLGTYPPRVCGIATFTQDLVNYCKKFLGPTVSCKVAAINFSSMDIYKYPPDVAWEIDRNNDQELIKFAQYISNEPNIQGIILQHEYGIFGGLQGEKILLFMQHCKKPILVTFHTMLPKPDAKMKEVTTKIIQYATSAIVLTHNSKTIIEKIYPISIGKTFIVPHGIHPTTFSAPKQFKEKLELRNHVILSTLGLLSRGKGIEYVIHSLPAVIEKYPSLLYVVLGETHPTVRREEGETYRLELEELVKKLGLESHVRFYNQFLYLPELFEFLKATDIYISTSTNPDQAVSGTLSYALGSGRAVISTDFAQAKEIITPETGRLIPMKNPQAFTSAILDLLGDEKRLKRMRLHAYRSTRQMLWSNVSEKYITLLNRTITPQVSIDHLLRMTDEFGLFQFASSTSPDKASGYTVDDNARALIVCSWLIKKNYTKELEKLISIYLSFMKRCQRENGSFFNYISFPDKVPTDQNHIENLEDTQGRSLWALSEIMSNNFLSSEMTQQAKNLFLQAQRYSTTTPLTYLRAKAFAVKSFLLASSVLPNHKKMLFTHTKTYADSFIASLQENSDKEWIWFEQHLSYSNALLAESLLISGTITKTPQYIEKGIRALEFLISKTFCNGMYIPIGNSHWYRNNRTRSHYAQQPEDPSSMILALRTAYKITGNQRYKNFAQTCFSWYLGNNSSHMSLYDEKTGGCYDGLHPNRINANQGAESLVSYMMAHIALKEITQNM